MSKYTEGSVSATTNMEFIEKEAEIRVNLHVTCYHLTVINSNHFDVTSRQQLLWETFQGLRHEQRQVYLVTNGMAIFFGNFQIWLTAQLTIYFTIYFTIHLTIYFISYAATYGTAYDNLTVYITVHLTEIANERGLSSLRYTCQQGYYEAYYTAYCSPHVDVSSSEIKSILPAVLARYSISNC